MTITDFTTLKLADQLEYLYAEGVYLSKRKAADQTVILYQLNQLYIEIYYKKYRYAVGDIRCCEDTEVLNPYLDSILIDELFT